MKVSAVLFDLDGTLLDTLGDIAASMNAVLSGKGYPAHPAQLYRKFIGDGIETLVRRALPAGSADADLVAALRGMMRDEYSRRWADTTRPYPGVEALLDGLAARGTPMAVLSNKPDEFTKKMCDHYFKRWRFPIVIGESPALPKKPDPAAALHIARTLNRAPSEFIYLGDSGTDMATAAAAGMYPAGALWGFRDAGELLANGARALLERPEDLLDLWR